MTFLLSLIIAIRDPSAVKTCSDLADKLLPFAIKTLRWNYLRSFEINLLSLCIHNPHTVLLISWCSFGGKTGIFASCVIYCGTHLHIKALISPSERESGNSVIIGRVVAGDESVFGSGGRPRGERGSLWVLVLTMRHVLVGFVFFFFSSLPRRRVDEEVALLSFPAFSRPFEVSHMICLRVILMALLSPVSAVRGATSSFTGSRGCCCCFFFFHPLFHLRVKRGLGVEDCG